MNSKIYCLKKIQLQMLSKEATVNPIRKDIFDLIEVKAISQIRDLNLRFRIRISGLLAKGRKVTKQRQR